MELTLGPILFEWKREELLKFYETAVEMDVDTIYFGEVVCVKKRGLSFDDIARLAEAVEKAGKKAVISTLAVVSNEDELNFVREAVKLPFAVEANDMSVLNMTEGTGKEVFAGPHITAYNAPTIEFLKSVGVKRVACPVELPKDSIAYNIKNTGVDTEVFAHGKLPLAFSWRCYASRAYGLNKTACRHDCARHPEGIEIKTLENEAVFTLNGTSILSAKTHTLIHDVAELGGMGVKALRISPQYKDTAKVVDLWRRLLDNRISIDEALAGLDAITPEGFCNGWYHGAAGKDLLTRVNAGPC